MVHRISLLLLGDSRDRVLYGQTVGILCTGERGGCQGQSRANGSHTTAKHCYSWQWAAPARFPINSNWQSAGGARHRHKSRPRRFGYMLIYGVSSEAHIYMIGRRTATLDGPGRAGWMLRTQQYTAARRLGVTRGRGRVLCNARARRLEGLHCLQQLALGFGSAC